MRYIKLLYRLFIFKMNLKMMYRFDFWSAFFADGMLFIVQLLMFGTIFTSVNHINGWEFYQIVIFVGTFTLIDGMVMSTFFFGLIGLPDKIRTGELDIYLVKPVNTLFLISFHQVNPGSIMVTVLGLGIVGYGLSIGGVVPSVFQVLMYIAALISMYLLMFAQMVLIRVVAFWTVKVRGLMEIENSIIEMAFMVPGSAFRGITKILFMIVLPYGLIASGPTFVLTQWMSPVFYLWAVGAGVLFFGLAILAFKRGLADYSSASS